MTAFSDFRQNPWDSTFSDRVMDPEIHVVAEFDNLPGVYGIALQDRPVATTVTIVTNNTAATPYTEVTTNPLAGQFRVDYVRGLIKFNSADDGDSVEVNYSGRGSNVNIALIQELIGVLTSTFEFVQAEDNTGLEVRNSLGAVVANFGNGDTDDVDFNGDVNVADAINIAGTNIQKTIIDYSKPIGGLFTIDWPKTTNYTFNPATPRTYWPAWNLSAIDVTETVDNTDIPQASLDHLRAIYLIYLPGKSGEVSQWSVTVAGSDITFPNTTSANAILAAIVEDKEVQGTYTNGRTVNIDGSDFAITGINTVTRVVTVSGSPTTGSQTARFYHHRIAGSSTTARLFEVSGEGFIATNDADGYFIAGLRTRGYMQGHRMNLLVSGIAEYTLENSAGGSQYASGGAFFNGTRTTTGGPVTDGTNGTPLTRKITHGPAMSGIPYQWLPEV